MNNKKNVLVVINSITQHELLQIKEAIQISKNAHLKIKLSLAYVTPSLATHYFNYLATGLLIEKYYDEALNSLIYAGRELNIPKKDQWLLSGKIRMEVLRLATKLNSSFILASAQQIQELHHSLFFRDIHQHALIKDINHITRL